MKIAREGEDLGLTKLLTASVHRALVLPSEASRGETVCGRLSIEPISLLGVFAKTTGGALVDQGWLHVLGTGNRQHQGLIEWNTDKETMVHGLLLVALDAVGGAFAVNRSLTIADRGDVCYFSPKLLKWNTTGLGYDEFLEWVLTGDLGHFYEGLRWPGWELETIPLLPNHGILVNPPIADEGDPIEARPRMAVRSRDIWIRHLEIASTR